MIVFDLCCAAGDHRFEAWFASSDSFADQQARGLIACPVCGDSDVSKAVMAPRVGAKSNQKTERHAVAARPAPLPANGSLPVELVRRVIAEIAAKQAEMLPQSRWVGRDFAATARAMHDGRVAEKLIHGQVSRDEAEALREDGIAAMPLLVPFAPPDAVN
ncbi:DUF1178 family protein [Sphingopyxis alaskensis]|uniref:Uncharacterized protein n=1 Tax=Sphingopyxis alaskensis (strain DSM 13593 / LMG 18877 / RB2256) TaxID=317655 RepID=Q1GS71_SPHAL|nr:DUF1178 family protein [Sphingopyxis alaskensis]ABF53501.1 protein of unknown function DUF1178 [Sphingopyxis alaskensis RB2256]MCM3421078.1 DUF1178 family protein [Sphingopyxis alaskensis]